VQHFVEFTLRNRLLMMVLGAAILLAGYFTYRALPVDAFPDVTPSMVQVFAVTEGLAPEEVEQFVTYPIEVAMNGLPDLRHIRSVSIYGLSVVNIYFKDGTDIYLARQLVGERLGHAREQIPEGFGEPEMGPITTGMGQILFYYLNDESGTHSPQDLRELNDWIIKYNLQTIPGVTEVLSIGGDVKQYHVLIKPSELQRFGLSIHDVIDAVNANNANTGAQFIVENDESSRPSVGLAKAGRPEPDRRRRPTARRCMARSRTSKPRGGTAWRRDAERHQRDCGRHGAEVIDTNSVEVTGWVKQRLPRSISNRRRAPVAVPYSRQGAWSAKCRHDQPPAQASATLVSPAFIWFRPIGRVLSMPPAGGFIAMKGGPAP
jgi:hypothetical protein